MRGEQVESGENSTNSVSAEESGATTRLITQKNDKCLRASTNVDTN